jgi:hypothetical protein
MVKEFICFLRQRKDYKLVITILNDESNSWFKYGNKNEKLHQYLIWRCEQYGYCQILPFYLYRSCMTYRQFDKLQQKWCKYAKPIFDKLMRN